MSVSSLGLKLDFLNGVVLSSSLELVLVPPVSLFRISSELLLILVELNNKTLRARYSVSSIWPIVLLIVIVFIIILVFIIVFLTILFALDIAYNTFSYGIIKDRSIRLDIFNCLWLLCHGHHIVGVTSANCGINAKSTNSSSHVEVLELELFDSSLKHSVLLTKLNELSVDSVNSEISWLLLV